MTPPRFEDILDAADRLRGPRSTRRRCCARTPWTRLMGGRVFVKAEALQRTGSFKFRGAYNRLSRLSAWERRRGVVAYLLRQPRPGGGDGGEAGWLSRP